MQEPIEEKTLRDLWIEHGFKSQEMADQAGISRETLYKMNRKERVSYRSILSVCRVLGITRAEYKSLEKCPMAERYRQEGK